MEKYFKENIVRKILAVFFMTLVILTLFVLTAFAEEKKEEVEIEFHKADVVNDGKIDRGEFDIYHHDVFKELDSNHDQVITPEECVSNCFTDKSKVQKMDNVKYEFNNIDIDGSGVIQIYEFILHGREKFRVHDVNGDNLIDKNEFCSFYQATMPCAFIVAEEGNLK